MKNIFLIAALFIVIGGCFTSTAQIVTLDYYFNHEVHTTKAGITERFHYLWEDSTENGYSIWGTAFKNNGGQLKSLDVAPTAKNLKGSAIYIIVDPDTKKESPDPKYIEEPSITEIVKWVKAGGVLVMMANDSANVELPHYNNLAAKFGMHFNDDLQNHVVADHFEDGAVIITGNPVFKTTHKVYMKDVCSIGLTGPAVAVLKNKGGAVIIASAKFGKGTVVAVGDPWLYNEYTNGRLPADFENNKAANDFSAWLLSLASGR
jgi:hypothetical protein